MLNNKFQFVRERALHFAELFSSSIQFFKHFIDGVGVSALTLKCVSQSNEALTNQPVFLGCHPYIDIVFMFEHLPSLLAL